MVKILDIRNWDNIKPHRLIVVKPNEEIRSKLKELYRKKVAFDIFVYKDGTLWILWREKF